MGSIMGFFDGIYDLLVGSSSYKHIQSYKRDDLLRWWTYDEDIFLNRFEIINQCSCSEYETVRYLAFLLVEISLRCHQAPVPVPYQCGIISLYIYWLVVWNISYCSIQLGIIIPICELIFFRGVGIPPTSTYIYNIIYTYILYYIYYIYIYIIHIICHHQVVVGG